MYGGSNERAEICEDLGKFPLEGTNHPFDVSRTLTSCCKYKMRTNSFPKNGPIQSVTIYPNCELAGVREVALGPMIGDVPVC